VAFAVGWRARGRTGELIAPAGAMGIVGSLTHFLWGSVPDTMLIAVDLSAMVVLALWFVRLTRASRERLRLLRNRQ